MPAMMAGPPEESMSAAGSEEWRPIPEWDGLYEASSAGRIRSVDRTTLSRNGRLYHFSGKELRPSRNPRNGYAYVTLLRTGDQVSLSVHSLVAAAFIGVRPPGMEVCHVNGDRRDDRAANLRYDTPTGNQADKATHGTLLRGDAHPNSKLTAADVATIKLMIRNGRNDSAIASGFNVSPAAVREIRLGRNWKHVHCQPDVPLLSRS